MIHTVSIIQPWHAVLMHETSRDVRAQPGSPWLFLFPRAHVCVSHRALRPYSRASRHVSGLPGASAKFFFFFLSSPPSLFCVRSSAEPLWSTADPHGPDPPARISRSTLRKTDTSARMDGRGGSRTDVDGCFLNQDRLKWLFLATSCDFPPRYTSDYLFICDKQQKWRVFFCLSFFFFFLWEEREGRKERKAPGCWEKGWVR